MVQGLRLRVWVLKKVHTDMGFPSIEDRNLDPTPPQKKTSHSFLGSRRIYADNNTHHTKSETNVSLDPGIKPSYS